VFDSLCIFTNYGRTYTFKEVTIVCDNETILQFRYKAMSDSLVKVGTFPKSGICGWSTSKLTDLIN